MFHSRMKSKLCAMFLFAGIAAGLHAQKPTDEPVAKARITVAVDDSNLITLKGNVSSLASAANDLGPADGSLQLGRVILVLKGSPAQQAALDKLTNDQQNSRSSHYHQWLTPQQYGERFGVAVEDLDQINTWLTSHGFAVEPQMAGRNVIIFSGTNAQLKQAFHTEMHTYKLKGETYTAIAADPQIPAAFGQVIRSFSPNNFPLHAQHSAARLVRHDDTGWKDADGGKSQFTFTDSNGNTLLMVAPYDLATMYNIKPLWDAGIDGTGQSIAIVSDSNISRADVDYFRQVFGLPPTKLNIINYGPDPGIGPDQDEADLDVQWSGAVAKNATIDLVVSPNTAASQGVVGSAIYIINNNTAPLLNVSYGACEMVWGTANNQLFNYFWEQAAAQGITVLSASGDGLVAGCDRGSNIAQFGIGVNTLATTGYNVSVGGTDLSGNSPDASKYWNATNDPTTLQSLISYVPETPWNNSCANPMVLAALQAQGSTTDRTTLELCNDPNEGDFLDITGAGGGPSTCYVTGDATNPCISGYPKPAWQSGVNGIPNDGVRDQPDVSLFAANGLFGSFYPFCTGSFIPGGQCDVHKYILGAGGTSFSTPIFAGMLALVQQKHGSASLGNVNNTLYKMASAEYADSTSTACSSETVAAGNSCVFYDISQGSIAAPCLIFSPDCNSFGTTQQIGITTGFDAAPGYDLASGLGTVNAYNMVEQWDSTASMFHPTVTTISVGTATIVYGDNVKLATTVAPVAPIIGVPSGDVGFLSNDTAPGSASIGEATLSKGQGALTAPLYSAGTYQLFANYAGDATFAPSVSAGVTVTVNKAVPVTALTSTSSSVNSGQNVTFSLTESGVLNGVPPTGTVTFTNTTTGTVLPIESLPESGAFNGVPFSVWLVTVPASQVQTGINTITAVYSGDSNYLGATATPVTVTEARPSFTTSFDQPSLVLSNGTGTLAVIVTATGSTLLTPNSIALSCPAAVGLTCSFGPNVVDSNGVLTSILTVRQSPSSLSAAVPGGSSSKPTHAIVNFAGGLAGLLFLLAPKRRRKYDLLGLCVLIFSGLMFTAGCSSVLHPSSVSQQTLIATTTTLSVNPTIPIVGTRTVFTAKVKAVSEAGVPSGTVTFSSGSATLGTSPLVAGSATFTSNSLPQGSQAVIATYSGDSAHDISSSAVTVLNVSAKVALTVTATDALGDKSSANVAVLVP